jgi:NAD(P)-dependent dehydrogenase (short-subunit alcohol dehydrogenase family)
MQAAYPHLKASEQGRVINFGSLAGLSGLVGMCPYGMAKEAVRALTRTAAREWAGDNITVKCPAGRGDLGTGSGCSSADQRAGPLWFG